MPEKKFDLNKALQAAQLYTPIDYGYTPQFDISTSVNDFNNTSNNVLSDIDWVGSGVRARKEEQEKRDNLPWHSKLGYAVMSTTNPGDAPYTSALVSDRYMVGDVEGAKEIQKTQDKVGSIASAASILGAYGIGDFATAVDTYGMKRALMAEGLSSLIGTGSAYAGNRLGQTIDKRHGTNIAPWLSTIGGFIGGVGGYKSGLNMGSKNFLNNPIYSSKNMIGATKRIGNAVLGAVQHPKRYYRYYKFIKNKGSNILNNNHDEIYDYSVNRQNYYSNKEFGKSFSSNPKAGVKFNFLTVPNKHFLGQTNTTTGEIKLNMFHPHFVKLLNEGKTATALNRLLNKTGVHELQHLETSNSILPELYIKGGDYYVANPQHPLYKRVLYLFDKVRDNWGKNPDEIVAEMAVSRKNLGKNMPYSQLSDREKDLFIRPINNRFSGLSKNDIRYIIDELDGFGYKQGGKIK